LIRKAIILAAGRGTRLGSLTLDRPKPMVEVAGKPVLEHILQGLAGSGLEDFLLVVGYKREAIEEYFQDGSRWGVTISYAIQEVPSGTGAALRFGEGFAGGDPIVMSYGDIFTDSRHYQSLVRNYVSSPCAAIIGINPGDPSSGAAAFHENGRLLGVKEKPKPGEPTSNWNLAGVSLYSSAIWQQLGKLKPSPRGEYEITDAITGLIDSGEEVRAEEMVGFWSDVGTPQALQDAEREWLRRPFV